MASLIQLYPGAIIPIAPAARGKSSLAERLITAGLNSQAVVGWDKVRLELCPSQNCACPNARPGCLGQESCFCQSAAAVNIVSQRLSALADKKDYFYLDGTNLKARDWRLPLALTKENGIQATALLFSPLSLEELKKRNLNRSRQVPQAALEKHMLIHQGVTIDRLKAAGFDAIYLIDDQTEFIL